MQNHTVPATLPLRKCNGKLCTPTAWLSGVALAFALAAVSGCSQPVTGSIGTAGTEIGRGIAGYNDTQYVYPVRVPGSNQIVEMRVSEPLAQNPTYEDYLKWKENN